MDLFMNQVIDLCLYGVGYPLLDDIGGTTRAQWEDVTGSTPLTFVNDCVSFTTTVSARFWLVDCRHASHDVTKMATDLYREAIHVPFMAKFVLFAKRIETTEARLRVFCMTDDREEKTLEGQENFTESRDVEVLEGKPQWIEMAGNLAPVTKSGEQLRLKFFAFKENRLPFLCEFEIAMQTCRKNNLHERIQARRGIKYQSVTLTSSCLTKSYQMNLQLQRRYRPHKTAIAHKPTPKQSLLTTVGPGEIHRADLKISDVANLLGDDWIPLARHLGITEPDVSIIEAEYPQSPHQQATVMLRLWMQQAGDRATGNALEKALNSIGRDDIVAKCIGNIAPVTDASEKILAQTHVEGVKTIESQILEPIIKSEKRNLSLDVSYDEQDLMKVSVKLI
ncbi:Ankyrin-3 [Orchesella cincta]|uniref:Ankyrin-3 n=1 Tax=Orchesella cincta TaxID=48709 RepID=A0A1D2MPU7_ORCCI|nr:Ankyrin-3 [Orchesella cincta]